MTKEEQSIADEYNKCKNSPYYFATKYWTVNGKPFTTELSEEEFNRYVRMVQSKYKK